MSRSELFSLQTSPISAISAPPSREHDNDNQNENIQFLPTQSATNLTPTVSEMGSNKHNRNKPSKDKINSSSLFFQHLTTGAHASLLLFVILIVYFCFSEDFHFFTWHPLLLSIGWMFLMSEAVLSMSKNNILTGTLPKVIRVRLHWIFEIIAITLIIIGFTIVFINKNNLNKNHFVTWHGLLGLIAIICIIPSVLNGVAALYNLNLRLYFKPKIMKFLHIFCGTMTYTIGGLTLILSVYSKWFSKQSNDSFLIFVFALILVSSAVGLTLIKPIGSCFTHIKHNYLHDY